MFNNVIARDYFDEELWSNGFCGPELWIDCHDFACGGCKESYGCNERGVGRDARTRFLPHFSCSTPAPTQAELACFVAPSSTDDRDAGRVVLNWTRSFEKSKSRVQSKATRTFFSNRGSFIK